MRPGCPVTLKLESRFRTSGQKLPVETCCRGTVPSDCQVESRIKPFPVISEPVVKTDVSENPASRGRVGHIRRHETMKGSRGGRRRGTGWSGLRPEVTETIYSGPQLDSDRPSKGATRTGIYIGQRLGQTILCGKRYGQAIYSGQRLGQAIYSDQRLGQVIYRSSTRTRCAEPPGRGGRAAPPGEVRTGEGRRGGRG